MQTQTDAELHSVSESEYTFDAHAALMIRTVGRQRKAWRLSRSLEMLACWRRLGMRGRWQSC